METREILEKAGKVLRGYAICKEVQINVEAFCCREVMIWETGINFRPKKVIGKYLFRGKLLRVPDFMKRFIGWNLVVHFEEFLVRFRLLDLDGNIESVEQPDSSLPAEEIWRICGGQP